VGWPSSRAFPETQRPLHRRFVLDEESLEHGLHTDGQDHPRLERRRTVPRSRDWSSPELLIPPSRLLFPDLRKVGGLREKTIEVHRLLPPAIASLGIPGRNEIPRDDRNVEG
jgi:hypothetical protein